MDTTIAMQSTSGDLADHVWRAMDGRDKAPSMGRTEAQL